MKKVENGITSINNSSSITSKNSEISNTRNILKKAYSLNIDNSKLNQLLSIINKDFYKINNIVPINHLTVLSNIGILHPGSKITSIMSNNGYIYMTDPNLQYVYKLSDLSPSTPSIFESLKNGISIPLSIVYSYNAQRMFLYDQNKGVFRVNPLSGAITNISSPVSNTKNIQIQTYMGNVYVLDTKSGNMYIVNPQTFSKSLDFHSPYFIGAKSFSVDGNIFVIDKNGNIKRFYANSITPFGVSNTTPMLYPLGNSVSLYDNQYSNYIYVFDPQHLRIVLLQKPQIGSLNTIDYSFLRQYIYTGANKKLFESSSQMYISSNGTSAYLLSGNDILKIKL